MTDETVEAWAAWNWDSPLSLPPGLYRIPVVDARPLHGEEEPEDSGGRCCPHCQHPPPEPFTKKRRRYAESCRRAALARWAKERCDRRARLREARLREARTMEQAVLVLNEP